MKEQELQNIIFSLKNIINKGENYAHVEDVIAVTKAVKKVTNEIRESIKDLDVEMAQKLIAITGQLQDAVKLHEKNLRKQAEFTKLISDLDKKLVTTKAEITAQIPSLDLMTDRHNSMEFELAQVDSKIEIGVNEIKTEFKSEVTQLKEKLEQELEEVEERLKGEIVKTTATPRSIGSRRVYQPHIDRFTAETDGVTKTFYLKREPLRTDTIEVSGTDFPIILDPTVDFTVAGKAVTLTDRVPAPSQGATLIIKYYA